ncbi:MAG: hypothetical protein OQK82_07510 [Candidatus Pacearchaeota archaeon]|nr:hypothetical protein [Candidatus Pacearchaeota archaeon]
MIDKEKLIKEFKEEFDKTKNEVGFSPSFEELDAEFFLILSVLSAGFVSPNFSRQLCSRIAEGFNNWFNYFHDILMPNPSNMFMSTEAKIFNSKEDKERIWSLIKKGRELTSLYALSGLKDKINLERKFIDETYEFWINVFKPSLTEIMQRVHNAWKNE